MTFFALETISLEELLKLGKGEQKTNGQAKQGILAESFEALFGAMFLDLGYGKTAEAVPRALPM